jgi:hypothetical protein
MTADKIAPTLKGPEGAVSPVLCRLSPDGGRLAYWVRDGAARGLYVGDAEWGELIGEAAQRVWAGEAFHVGELAWSRDGRWLAFTTSSGPPPGDVAVGVLHVERREFTSLSGIAFAWAGGGATLIVADSLGKRLYLKDLGLGVEHPVAPIADDGDPHFPPAISVSPDQRRFAVVTRQVEHNLTRVHLAHHDGRQWQAQELTQVPGTAVRVLPFWSPDSTACGLYVIDLAQKHTAMIGVPQDGGAGDILYTSNSVDDVVTPAVHPQGRLIAFVRSHSRQGGQDAENRLVLLDPVEHAVAPIAPDGEVVGQLRWLDETTLLVEGGPAVWKVRLRATEEAAATATSAGGSPGAATEGFVRTVVQDVDPALSFACDVPADWQRVLLPSEEADFSNPLVMRPIALFAPTYATVLFTVATRPVLPETPLDAALATLARAQGFEIGEVRTADTPFGRAAETLATGRSGQDVVKLRLLLVEHRGHLLSLTTMAPAPLWDALRPTLDRVVESFSLRAAGPV